MHLEVPISDFKTMFGGKIQSCFTGKDAVVSPLSPIPLFLKRLIMFGTVGL